MRRLWGVLGVSALVVVAGCVGDSNATTDAGSDVSASDQFVAPETSSNDAGDSAAPQCDVSKPFNAPTLVSELDTSGYEGHLVLAANYLSGYFQSTRGSDAGAKQVYSTTRTALTSPFANVTLVNNESVPSVTGDDLELYSLTTTINLATRTNTSTAFGPTATVAGLTGFDYASVREDGAEIYVHGQSDSNIYRAQKVASGFSAPTLVTELVATGAIQYFVTVTPDDLVIYYASTRTDVSSGALDVWVATRSSSSVAFGQLKNVTELNTTADDRPSFITRDRCTLYFTRRASVDAGVVETIWVATKAPS